MATVGIRKYDACRMFTQLIQGMYPEVQKVTVERKCLNKYKVKVKRPQGIVQCTGYPDELMKSVLEELSHGKVKETE